MRDVRRRDHLAPGLQVKIVRPQDEATGLTVEGEIAEIVGREPFDAQGIVVKLATGEVGRVLRVWEGGRAREVPVPDEPGARRATTLPSYDPPREQKLKFQFALPDADVEKRAREAMAGAGKGELDRMIQHHEEGLGAPLLRRYGIRSEELAQQSADLLKGVDDDELTRRLGRAGVPEERTNEDDADLRDDDDEGDREPPRRRR